jgi:hypothetical protein
MKKCILVARLLMVTWAMLIALAAMALLAPIAWLSPGKVYNKYRDFFGKLIDKLSAHGDALIKKAEEL